MKRRGNKRYRQTVATALAYNPENDVAPRVLATGSGALAYRIQKIARENGIPVHSDPEVAELLNQLPPGSPIPETMYRTMAAIFALLVAYDKSEIKESTSESTNL